jgi:hypothetical protein
MGRATRYGLFAAALLAGSLAAPAAHADWRGRGHGWGGPPVYHHHHRGWNGAPLLGAIIGLGAGVAIGSALAAPPPPVVYQPPPVLYQPPPRWVQPAPVYLPPKPAW